MKVNNNPEGSSHSHEETRIRICIVARRVANSMLEQAFKGYGYTSDVIAHVLNSLDQVYGNNSLPDNPEAWAATVARNKAVSLLRHIIPLSKLIELREDIDSLESGSAKQSGFNLDSVLDDAEQQKALFKLLDIVLASSAKLDTRGQETFDLIYRKRVPMGKLADELGLPPNTISQRWGRMLEDLAHQSYESVREDALCSEVFAAVLGNKQDWYKAMARLIREALRLADE